MAVKRDSDVRRVVEEVIRISWQPRSARKRKTGKTRTGNRPLRMILSAAAWAAARGRNTYLARPSAWLAMRRGAKTAAVAVGHSILVAMWHLLCNGVPYADVGASHFD